jgi:transposase
MWDDAHGGDWYLQEDHDPSHGTKTTNNVAYELKMSNWMSLVVHPGQSPDLNPTEGCWLILKQRTKKRLAHSTEWDGTIKHLQAILTEEWDKITLQEIRELISELPSRCKELTRNGGARMRSEKW